MYYAENGEVTKNQIVEIEGTKYAFDENGDLIKNAEKDGYKIDENGVATEVTLLRKQLQLKIQRLKLRLQHKQLLKVLQLKAQQQLQHKRQHSHRLLMLQLKIM